MLTIYNESDLIGIMWFVDNGLVKNRKFYNAELSKISTDYNVELKMFYGKPLFDFMGFGNVWDEILDYLKRWRDQIPDFPEINFDLDAEETFEDIKILEPSIFRNILKNKAICEEIIPVIFPQKETLKLLKSYFESQKRPIYKTLAKQIDEKLL